MNYREYVAIVKSQISSRSYIEQLKFAVLVCQKLYFYYQKFYTIYEWGNPDLLIDAILLCQKAIDNSTDINQIKKILPEIDKIVPETEDFGNELGSYALNASAVVYETLAFIADRNSNHIYNIATYYTDTVDFKIQEEKSLSQEEKENHPLMIEAWNFVIEETRKHG